MTHAARLKIHNIRHGGHADLHWVKKGASCSGSSDCLPDFTLVCSTIGRRVGPETLWWRIPGISVDCRNEGAAASIFSFQWILHRGIFNTFMLSDDLFDLLLQNRGVVLCGLCGFLLLPTFTSINCQQSLGNILNPSIANLSLSPRTLCPKSGDSF